MRLLQNPGNFAAASFHHSQKLIRGSPYPLIPPPVTPAMIFSDKKIYRIKVGKNTITTAANMPAQSPVYFMELIMEYRPTAMGRSLSELANIREMKYSFQILIKLNMVTVMIPG